LKCSHDVTSSEFYRPAGSSVAYVAYPQEFRSAAHSVCFPAQAVTPTHLAKMTETRNVPVAYAVASLLLDSLTHEWAYAPKEPKPVVPSDMAPNMLPPTYGVDIGAVIVGIGIDIVCIGIAIGCCITGIGCGT